MRSWGVSKAVDGVVTVSPIVTGQVIAAANGRATFGQVRGVREAHLEARPLLTENVLAGTLDGFAAGEGVVIGNRMARRIGVGVGDSITLLSPEGRTTLMGSVPRSRAYPVAAIFEIGMFEYDNTFVFMPLDLAQIYFRKKGAVTAIEMTVADPERIREVEAGREGRSWAAKAGSSTGAGPTRSSSMRSRSSATSCS